jgi:hypothetical protein
MGRRRFGVYALLSGGMPVGWDCGFERGRRAGGSALRPTQFFGTELKTTN